MRLFFSTFSLRKYSPGSLLCNKQDTVCAVGKMWWSENPQFVGKKTKQTNKNQKETKKLNTDGVIHYSLEAIRRTVGSY